MLLSKDLRRLSKLYNKALAIELPNIKAELIEVLLFISSQNKKISQKIISDYLLIDKSRMTSIISDLFKSKLIDIKANPLDRREHFILLTGHGIDLIPKLIQAVEKTNILIFNNLDISDLVCFYKTIEQIDENLTVNSKQQ